jgi:hypothetical protein
VRVNRSFQSSDKDRINIPLNRLTQASWPKNFDTQTGWLERLPLKEFWAQPLFLSDES